MMNNKTVVITGAARGIGSAIALRFAKEGANIVMNYHSTKPDQLMSEILEEGVQVKAVKGDVGNFEEAKIIIDTAKETFGSIDVLINNAGITKDGLLMTMKEEDFDTVINTNLKGAFNMIRHASRYMLKQRSGAVINIASVVGIIGNTGQANYAASKAGLIGLTKSAAREMALRNVTVNAIAPGFIKSDMTNRLSEEYVEQYLNNIPLKRLGLADEVADAAVFLARSTYITGQVLNVDGGMVMQ